MSSCARRRRTPRERIQPIWGQLAELGLFALLVPEDRGGLGLGGVEAALIAEALGRWAVPGPVVETAFLAPYVINRWGTDATRSWLGWHRRGWHGDRRPAWR